MSLSVDRGIVWIVGKVGSRLLARTPIAVFILYLTQVSVASTSYPKTRLEPIPKALHT